MTKLLSTRVDKLLYQSIDGITEAVMRHAINIDSPCMACLNGQYITGDITEKTLEKLEDARG